MTTTDTQRRVYRGEALRAIAMPLGGIGTGSIALCGDGSLRQWQIQNRVNHMACLPHSFFAAWAKPVAERPSQSQLPKEPAARVLQSSALYDTQGLPAPPTSNDHIVPVAQRELLRHLPGVEAVEFMGEYPIAELIYYDPVLPIQVKMEAFNPFIPLESRDSGLPVVIFNLTASNPNPYPVQASLVACLQNSIGWDGIVPLFDAQCAQYGGNTNTLVKLDDLSAIQMNNSNIPQDHENYGNLGLCTLSPDATYLAQWDDLQTFWTDFSSDGRLNNSSGGSPSPAGRTYNGALAVPFSLQAGESHTVTFIMAWYFPNRYVNFAQKYSGILDQKSKFWIGNQYNHWFNSALDVVNYVHAHITRLTHLTRLARDTFFDTTLPGALIEAVTSPMSIIRSPSCFWADDSRFYGFEGCRGASTGEGNQTGGCCPLNCTHVWNYEMSLARLFPGLERSMRETEWEIQQHPSGYLPHRVVLPTYLPRAWEREIGGPAHPALDGLLGAILKTYREYLACGDLDWLSHLWPGVTTAMNHIWAVHDPGKSGVILGEQPNTYDISIYGANTFIGTLYLAALRAVEVMATLLGEELLVEECRRVFQRGQESLETRLWNGEYYIQDVDLKQYPEQNWGTGCHADHLLGQWWAYRLDLGSLMDPEHMREAVKSIYRYNFREHFEGFAQRPRAFVTETDQGLLNCTWPRGGRPEVPTLYSDEVWTGIEYEVAALLLDEGNGEAALQIIEAVRHRYDGRKQSPWNDIECGDHYVRAMSSWALLEAASGYSYNAGMAMIRFSPRLSPDNFRAPFVVREGWGTYTQRIDVAIMEATLSLAYGSLDLSELCLTVPRPVQEVSVKFNGNELPASLSVDGNKLTLIFSESIKLHDGQALGVKLSIDY